MCTRQTELHTHSKKQLQGQHTASAGHYNNRFCSSVHLKAFINLRVMKVMMMVQSCQSNTQPCPSEPSPAPCRPTVLKTETTNFCRLPVRYFPSSSSSSSLTVILSPSHTHLKHHPIQCVHAEGGGGRGRDKTVLSYGGEGEGGSSR